MTAPEYDEDSVAGLLRIVHVHSTGESLIFRSAVRCTGVALKYG